MILLGIVSRPASCGPGAGIFTNVGRYRTWIAHVLRGGDPRLSLPELGFTRVDDRGPRVRVRVTWCQAAARGHRIRVDIGLHGAPGGGAARLGLRRVLRGRAAGLCERAVASWPDTLPPGRYLVQVKVKDLSAGVATPSGELFRGAVILDD